MSFTAETAHLYDELKFIRELTSYLLMLFEHKLLSEETYRGISFAILTRKNQIDKEIENYNKLHR